MLKPLITCFIAGLFCCTCNASLVFYYNAYLLEGRIGTTEFLQNEKDQRNPDGSVTFSFDLTGDVRTATLRACKTTPRVVPLTPSGGTTSPEELSLTRLGINAAKTVTDTVTKGLGIATVVATTLARQLSTSPHQGYFNSPYGLDKYFQPVEASQAGFIPTPEKIIAINSLLHFFYEVPINAQYVVMETDEIIGTKRQLTSKTIRLKLPGQTSIMRQYVLPADKKRETPDETHQDQVDFRAGYQPVFRLLPDTTGGSLQPANALGLARLSYYMPSLNPLDQPETVMGLSSFLEMSRYTGAYHDITKMCWLPELLETSSDSKVICSFSTQMNGVSESADQTINDEDEDKKDEDMVECLLDTCTRNSYQTNRKADMESIDTMQLEKITRVSQIRLPGDESYVNAYSTEDNEWQYLLWYHGSFRILLVKVGSHNGFSFHNPFSCPDEEQLKTDLDDAINDS